MKQLITNIPLHLGSFGLRRAPWLSVVFFAGISLVLAGRTLYTAPDDENYIARFEGTNFTFLGGWWSYVLEEPLWASYAPIMGGIFGSEPAMRITIFFSAFIFLIGSGKLTRGAWMFVLLVFILDDVFATQMYYNQIRQGFALSIFFGMVALGLSPFLGAVMASAIHTSFLFVIPCAIAAHIVKRSNIRLIAVLLTAIASVYYINTLIDTIDFGRRNYELTGKLNIFFYVLITLKYGSIFAILKYKFPDEQEDFWFRFSLIFTILALCLTLIHEAMGRLMYLADALVTILIGLHLKRNRTKIGALVWMLFLLAISINEGRRSGFGPDSWFGRWVLILT